MIVEGRNREKITVSFSGSVGREGLKSIKNYIEFLEKAKPISRKKIPQSTINKLADNVTASTWKRIRKEKKLE